MDHDLFEILKIGSYFGAWLLRLINIGVGGWGYPPYVAASPL